MRPVLVPLVVTLAIATGCETSQGTPPPWSTGQPGATPAASPSPAPAASPSPAPAPASPAGSQAPVAGQAAPPLDASRTLALNEARNRKWKNEDFVEGDANRDPFHSYISDFSAGPTVDTHQYDILLSKYSLDELKLSMITSPRGGGRHHVFKQQKNDPECDLRPCAVFVDAAGVGWSISRNFHISKADAKVVRIDPEKGQVYVELREDLGNGKFRTVERVLEMHQSAEGTNP